MKRCTRCGETKALDDFPRDKRRRDDRASSCRECDRERKARYRAENADKVREQQARYRAENADKIRERSREYSRRRVASGRDAEDTRRKHARRAARSDAEIAADRARLRPDGLKRCRTCREPLPLAAFGDDRSRPDALRASCRDCAAARAARRYLGVYLDDWERRDLWTCAYCGGPFSDVEHVEPVSLGGLDVPENTVPACWSCNRGPGGKHDRPLFDWRPDLYDLVKDWPRRFVELPA
ncbi:HNH endonuclease [Agromyces sp. H66]|uniref:HNH endonuclease n=1 Tax=Agromyces sp. H66 TaxID=2529859 RepID=UPI00145AB78D|nr:HNH endonuclease [Agromyces sp. H66]